MRHQVNLLIVDNRDVYEAMEPVLRAELQPDKIVHCDTHQEAMAAVKGHVKYDLIFADWHIAGESFVEAVRANFANHYSPVIVTLSDDNDTQIGKIMRCGANDMLVKPFLKKALLTRIRRITHAIESRRHLRVTVPEPVAVKVAIEDTRTGARTAVLQMIDISDNGCKVKAPTSCGSRIYDRAKLSFTYRDTQFDIAAFLVRLEAETKLIKSGGDYMFASFAFDELDERTHENLNQLLDDLSQYVHED